MGEREGEGRERGGKGRGLHVVVHEVWLYQLLVTLNINVYTCKPPCTSKTQLQVINAGV